MCHLISSPKLELHNGIHVVRDDLIPGGTKARLFLDLMSKSDLNEFVYAGPAFGAAQIALAAVAYQLNKRATLFVPWSKELTRYTREAKDYGAKVISIRPGYFSVLKKRAEEYCLDRGAQLIPLGGGDNFQSITRAANTIDFEPETVWCAGGSGTLARALKMAWPKSQFNLVEVGRTIEPIEGVTIHRTSTPFSKAIKAKADFPLHPNYEAKAWKVLQQHCIEPRTLFWNVHG